MQDKETSFSYTYSAAQQKEVERIRKKYLPQQEDKMELLRKLDRSATQKAQTWAIAVGVIGSLVLGSGMSLFMSDLGAFLGMHQIVTLVVGIVLGVVGLALVALAYPIYNRVLQKERRRVAPEILRLTEELMR